MISTSCGKRRCRSSKSGLASANWRRLKILTACSKARKTADETARFGSGAGCLTGTTSRGLGTTLAGALAAAFARSGGRFAVRVGFAFGLATTAGPFALAFTAGAFFAPAASALGLLCLVARFAAALARFGEDELAPP